MNFRKDLIRCMERWCKAPALSGNLWCRFHEDKYGADERAGKLQVEPVKSRAITGFVYAIEADLSPRRIKLGYSVDVQGRLEALQLCAPVDLKLLGQVPGNRWLELTLHRVLKNDRARGEWFHSTPSVEHAVKLITVGKHEPLIEWMCESRDVTYKSLIFPKVLIRNTG